MTAHAFALTRIPRGTAGTKATLRAMERLVESGVRDPRVVLYAQEAVRRAPEYGQRAELDAILSDVRRTMRYTLDPVGVETVKAPGFVLEEIQRRGKAALDCDDASVWTAALVRSVGIPTRFKVIRDDPEEFTHVYLEALTDRGWIPLDPIARTMPVGRAPRGQFGGAVWEGGRMYRSGMGATVTEELSTGAGDLVRELVTYQKKRLDKKLQRVEQPALAPVQYAPPPAAPAFPWGKVILVAGVGVGAILALRYFRRKGR